ncbi:MAG: autotransporter-associated beta strand repeat-containing protein [Thermoguttaceae bacterium]|nr:autotransporter-associated beta strand repeat-containing protein [Thermoguttaceae bacterium]
MTSSKRNMISSKIRLAFIAAAILSAALMTNAKADVSFNGTNFSGSGTYSEAVNSTSNLTATPDSGQTITFNNNIVSTKNFTQTGENVVFNSGTNNSFNMLYINNGSGNGAKMTLSGSMNLTELHVANAKTTHLAITEGATLNVSGIAYINEAKNAQGVITQTGGDVSFTTNGSTSVRIGHWPNTGYPSRYNISGGTLSIPKTITYVGWDGYAEMNISGGAVSLKGLSLSNNANAKGTLTLTGGTLNMGDGGVSRNKRGASSSIEPVIKFGSGTVNATASHTWASNLNITLNDGTTTTLNADAGKTITLASKLAGNGSITKTGEGTLILSNANTYTGTTTVEGGLLKLTGNGTTGTGALTVNGTVEYNYSDDKTIAYDIYGSGNLVKSGDGALTLPSYNSYSGKTTVSGGTLILPDAANFSSPEIEVKTGAYFKAGFNLDNASINVNGGNFVLGTDNSSSVGVIVPDITVSNGGIVSFNMIDYTDVWYGYDYLEINDSASMTSGYLNLVFNQDSNLWYDNITDDGYELITFKGTSDDFTFSNMNVLVNGTSTSKWRLEKTDAGVFLMKGSDGPAPVTPYWNANSGDDLALGQWTIDHNPKLGVQFTEGTNTASEYTGTVVMSENASFEVGAEKVLKMSGVISGSGAMEKIGAGTLYLSNANTYSGGTTISAGNVTISNPGALGTGSVTINGGTLDATPAGSAQTFNNDVVVGADGATISVATGEYSSFKSVSGSGDLTTNGYIHFNGNGGYNGHLTVASGFTRVNPGAFGVFDLTINQGGRFNIFDSGTVQIGKLNSTADVEVFGSRDVNVYTFEIGAGTTSSDSASFAGYIRGLPDKRNVTIKKVGEGTQTFCRTGYGYAGTNNSLKEIIIDGGKMVINANHSVFTAGSTTGYWGTAPITVNEGGTLEYARNWNTSPNVMLTVNGGTLALNSAQYQNLLTLNSATVNGTGQLRAGYVGSGTWTVKGGTSTIDTSISLVLKGNYKTLTVNFDSGSTLDIKKNLSGLDGYTGTAVVFNGTGDAPGNINFNSAAGAVTGLGAFTFNNMNATISYGTSWLGSGYFSGSSVTVKNSTLTTSCDHSTNNTVITLDNGVLNFDGKVNSYAHQIYMKNGSSITGTQFSAGHNWNSQFITQYENGTPENVMNEISADIAMYNTGRTITFNVADKAPLTLSGSLIPMDPGHYNALDKTGAGTLTLTAPNSHSTTTVSEGTLVLSGNGTFGTGDVVNNAAIEFAHTSEQTLTNAISGSGTVAKTGSGKLTISSVNTYTGDTTVSGGTLVLASSGSLSTPNLTVESGATFQTGANLASTNVALNGGSFVLGTSSSAAEITIADFALNGGTVNFDFYAATSATNYDYLLANATTLTSGAININFANNDELTWWNNTSGGYILIDTLGISGSLDNIELLVNSAQTSNWYLDTTGNYIVMKKQNDAPPVEDPYYLANTEEAISADKWTIDGQDKKGVKFTEGDENAATYGKAVEMNANGTVEVGEDRNLTLAGVVSGEGNVTKTGDGKLTLSGDNTNSGTTTVANGTLTLTGDAVKANSSIVIDNDATLEYNVAQDDSKQLTFTDDVSVSGGNVVKTGKGTLKIFAADGQFESNQFAVEAGELDFKGAYTGDLNVKSGATLSPGNSVGDLSVTGNVVIDASGTLLFEFSQYNDNPDMQEFDTLSIENASNELVLDANSIIKLFFTSAADANLWAAEGAEYKLVSDEGFVNDVTDMSDLLGNYGLLFGLEGRTDGLYLIGLGAGPVPEPGSGVPEPSTWALLILGVAALFLRKRVRN